jgi:hypothetical protein
MQDRYVGDVGDFAKYGLLRRLAGKRDEQPVRVGVVWCLFPDETYNNDGRHVSYIHRPEFEDLDDPFLMALRKMVASGKRRISAVSSAGLLPGDTVFCDATASVPKARRVSRDGRTRYRGEWLDCCLTAMEKCDLVFFDPDNGLEVVSVPKYHPNAGKYVYWNELAPFWQRGQTLLVYHHLNRTMSAGQQVRDLRDRFRTRFEDAAVTPLVFRRGSCRIFWLVYRSSALGAEMKRRAVDFLGSGWSKHFRPIDWPDESQVVKRSAS